MGAVQLWPLPPAGGASGSVVAMPRPPRARNLLAHCTSLGGVAPPRALRIPGATRGGNALCRGWSLSPPPAQTKPHPTLLNTGNAAGPGWTSQSRCVRLPVLVFHGPASPGNPPLGRGLGRTGTGPPLSCACCGTSFGWSSHSSCVGRGTSFTHEGICSGTRASCPCCCCGPLRPPAVAPLTVSS